MPVSVAVHEVPTYTNHSPSVSQACAVHSVLMPFACLPPWAAVDADAVRNGTQLHRLEQDGDRQRWTCYANGVIHCHLPAVRRTVRWTQDVLR